MSRTFTRYSNENYSSFYTWYVIGVNSPHTIYAVMDTDKSIEITTNNNENVEICILVNSTSDTIPTNLGISGNTGDVVFNNITNFYSTYHIDDNIYKSLRLSRTDNNVTITFNTTSSNPVSISLFDKNSEKSETNVITIQNRIANSSISPTSIDTILGGTITITPNSGYTLSDLSANVINNISDTDTETFTINGTISNNIGSIVIPEYDKNSYDIISIIINGTISETTNVITIQNRIANSSISPTSIDTILGGTITITPNSGYTLSDLSANVINNISDTDTETFTINGTISNNIGSIVIPEYDKNSYDITSIIINGTISETTKTQIETIDGTITHGSFTPTQIDVLTSNTITCTADNGYYFSEAPILTVIDEDTVSHTITGIIDLSNTSIATITFVPISTGTYSLSISGTAIVKPDVPTADTAFTNVYVCTESELNELGGKQIRTENNEIVDLRNYITSVLLVNFNAPESIKSTIILGNYDTEITSHLLAEKNITISLGTIHIDRINNNQSDYNDFEMYILLPFYGIESVDISKYMDRDLEIVYIINIPSGNAIIKLIVDNEYTIDIFNCNVGENIAYTLNNITYQIRNSINYDVSLLYDKIANVIIVYYDNLNDNKYNLLNDESYKQLSTLSGLTIIDRIDNTIYSMTSDESDLLTTILNNGVIF